MSFKKDTIRIDIISKCLVMFLTILTKISIADPVQDSLPKYYVSLKGGADYSKFYYGALKDLPGYKDIPVWGWITGISFIQRANNYVDLREEIIIKKKGFILKGPDNNTSISINYLSFPFHLLFGSIFLHNFSWKLYFGPEFEFLLGNKRVYTYQDHAPETDTYNNLKVFEFDANCGFQINCVTKIGILSPEIRYSIDINGIDRNIYNNPPPNNFGVFYFCLNYSFAYISKYNCQIHEIVE